MRINVISILMIAPGLLAQAGANCTQVGGAIITNFVDQTTTIGPASGDLKGGVGVTVLSTASGPNNSTVFHNQHRWVTESGETIMLAQADATAYPTPVPGVFAVVYNNGVQITGGTGRFAGSGGNLAIFGAVNLGQGQIVLRYQGEVCSKPVTGR